MSDLPKPSSEHASVILGNLWPQQSESAWRTFAKACMDLAVRLSGEEGTQTYIATVLAEGAGELATPNGPVPLAAGDLAQYRGDEELRVANTAEEGMTLLAFLAPEFPRPDAP